MTKTTSPFQEYSLVSVEEARTIMGRTSKQKSDTQITEILAKYQELAKWWLDEFEKKKFGKKLSQLSY